MYPTNKSLAYSMAKCCVVFSQSPFEDLTAFRVRHVLLLISILTSNAPGQWLLTERSVAKAQVTLCRSGGPDLYDLKNRREQHGRLIKSWQHRTDILVGKRSAVIGKPVRQSFTVKTLSCWSWLWLRSNHGSISVVCGIGNVVGLSYPAWGHSWTACGHSWTAYGWSWRSDQYNHSKLSN